MSYRFLLVASGHDVDLSRTVEPEGDCHGSVEEVAIVADDQHRPVIIGNHLLKQVESFEVEIVRRLIEHEQIRVAREFLREEEP